MSVMNACDYHPHTTPIVEIVASVDDDSPFNSVAANGPLNPTYRVYDPLKPDPGHVASNGSGDLDFRTDHQVRVIVHLENRASGHRYLFAHSGAVIFVDVPDNSLPPGPKHVPGPTDGQVRDVETLNGGEKAQFCYLNYKYLHGNHTNYGLRLIDAVNNNRIVAVDPSISNGQGAQHCPPHSWHCPYTLRHRRHIHHAAHSVRHAELPLDKRPMAARWG